MLEFKGEKAFSLTARALAGKLGDAGFLVGCVPGVVSTSTTSPTLASCVLRPGFSFARGTLEVTMQVIEPETENQIRLLLQSKGIGSSSEVEATLVISACEIGSLVRWSVEVKKLGGLLKAVPQGLISAAAQKVIADAWTSVEQRIAQEAGGAASP